MSDESPRDSAVLRHLAVYRCLTRSQLAAFLFDGSAIKAHSRDVIAQRILRRLLMHGLLTALSRPSGGPGGGAGRFGYTLTRAGYALTRARTPGLPSWRPALRSSFLMVHCIVTADVALAFHRAVQTSSRQARVEWESDWQVVARLGRSPVVPDAYLAYATASSRLHVFIEVDLDTEHPNTFAAKIGRYLDLYRSGTWRTQIPTWPVVLTVAPTPRRVDALTLATHSLVRSQPDTDVLVKATAFNFGVLADVLQSPGPLGPIWQVAGRAGLHSLVPEHSTADRLEQPTANGHWPQAPSGVERCVYVIELDDVEKPRNTSLPCVYVGQSAYPAEVRFVQHKQGYKSSRFVRHHGRYLRPDLCSHVACTPDWETALRREADLAVELRRAGYCVHGGH